jgi:hypothetical protein
MVYEILLMKKVNKSEVLPVTDLGGPFGCETSRLPHFLDNRLRDGSEDISLTCRPPFIHRKIPDIHL